MKTRRGTWLLATIATGVSAWLAACGADAPAGSHGGDDGSGGSSSTTAASTGGGGSSMAATTTSSSAGGGAPACDEEPCKLTLPQCGCPSGEQCTIGTLLDPLCIPEGTVAWGDSCSDVEECAPGLMCVPVPSTSPTVRTCMKFCDGDRDCQAPGGLCIIEITDDTTVCTENCNPLTNEGCPVSGTGCHIAQEPGGLERILTLCSAAGAGVQDASCIDDWECAPTFGCFDLGGPSHVCIQFCDVNAPSCSAGTTCTSFSTPTVFDGITYGVCL